MHVINLLLIGWEFISIINCTCYSVTYMGTRPLNMGTNRPITLCTVNHLYSWCTIKTTILQSGLFLSDFWCLLSLIQPLSPLDPRRPLHMLYICIATFNCPKGILGLGGGKHLKTNCKTPVSSFQWQTSQF